MKKKLEGYIYLLPVAIYVGLMIFLSVSESIKQSFGIFEAIGMNEFTLDYYKEVLSSSEFKTSFIFCLKFSLISSIISIIIGCYLAFFIKKYNDKFVMKLMKTSIILPHMLVGFLIFQLISNTGLFSRIFYLLGLSTMETFPTLVYDSNGIGLIISYAYKEICFIAFSFVAVLYRISDEYKYQAYVLGASKVKTFIYVTLPMIMPSIIYSFVIIFSYSFSSYELPVIIGPSSPKSLATIAYNYYTSPVLTDRPYAMVYNTILILVGLIGFVFFAIFYNNTVEKEASFE
ncbi:MAG: ABC transporter permease subunit [Finegoldia sp.]|nr:ABC transporter permease subunit [Finegoldia sp.]